MIDNEIEYFQDKKGLLIILIYINLWRKKLKKFIKIIVKNFYGF